jgi:hypothetical protein
MSLNTLSEHQIREYLDTQLKKNFTKNKDYIKLAPIPGAGIPRGIPDILLLFRKGTLICIEVKRPSGKLSAAQKIVHINLEQLGYKIYTVYTKKDIDMLIRQMKEI